MLAAISKAPAWAITVEESAKLSKAINDVTAQYDVAILDEKTRAWIGLAMVGVEVYGSRVATVVLEAKAKAKAKPAAAANVAPIRQQPAAAQAQAQGFAEYMTPPGAQA
jgi:hypothetical protein